jgi:hypothetical protein
MKTHGSASWTGGVRDGKGAISTNSGDLSAYPYGFSSRFEGDPGTNPEELIGAAHAVVLTEEGHDNKIYSLTGDPAVSFADIAQILSDTADDLNGSQAIAAANGLTPFATMEANYSILVRDAEKTIIPALRDHKMRLLAYFPLASGLLSGKHRGGAIPTGSRLDRMPFFKGSLPQNLGAIDEAALRDEGMDAAAVAASTWRDEMRAKGEARTQIFARSLIARGYSALLARSFAPGASRRDLNLVLWRWGDELPARLTLIDDEGRLAL